MLVFCVRMSGCVVCGDRSLVRKSVKYACNKGRPPEYLKLVSRKLKEHFHGRECDKVESDGDSVR